jgi:hypothetical protein
MNAAAKTNSAAKNVVCLTAARMSPPLDLCRTANSVPAQLERTVELERMKAQLSQYSTARIVLRVPAAWESETGRSMIAEYEI